MDLHRVEDGKADWEKVSPDKWNRWQRVAAKTRGWLTPGNYVTVAGNVLAFTGLAEIATNNTPAGLIAGLGMVVVGRVADVFDGRVANRTGTKSPKGEALDAGLDKAQIAAALPTFIAKDIMPLGPGLAIAGEQLVIAGLSGIAKARGREIHPSAAGKYSQFGAWASFATAGLEKVSEVALNVQTHAGEIVTQSLEWATYGTAAASVAAGAIAIGGYAKDAFGAQPPTVEVVEAQI